MIVAGLGKVNLIKSWKVYNPNVPSDLGFDVTVNFAESTEEGITEVGTADKCFPLHCITLTHNIIRLCNEGRKLPKVRDARMQRRILHDKEGRMSRFRSVRAQWNWKVVLNT